MRKIFILHILILCFVTGNTYVYASENASNPLASVNNVDIRLQYFDLDGAHRYDFWVADGAHMLTPKLKLKYEVHYWSTDVTGSRESDIASLNVKPIYFPKQGKMGTWKYKLAVGLEWIQDFGNNDKGIGSGSDQLAPFVGVALIPREGTVLIPLVQHFMSYDGLDVNQTAFRLIAIQSFPKEFWTKIDVKVPINWENDNAIPASMEVQVGKMFSESFGVYVEGLVGVREYNPLKNQAAFLRLFPDHENQNNPVLFR